MEIDHKTPVVDVLNAAVKHNREKIVASLDILNEAIRKNGLDDGPDAPIQFSALARLAYYLALAKGEATRGPKQKLEPQWSAVMEPYNEMCRALGGNLLPVMRNNDGLSSFCLFRTRRTGNHQPRFYAGLAAFAVYAKEKGLLDHPFIRMAVPIGERGLPDEIRALLSRLVDGGELTTPTTTSENAPIIRIGFKYNPERIDDFVGYRDLFARARDGCAHFVVYRPSRSDPTRLMKSFLAIKPAAHDKHFPTGRADVLNFVHVYEPPKDATGKVRRFSLGRVIPMDDGVYLVGGQRDDHDLREPFKSLKVLALPWESLRRNDTVVHALIMSTNYDGRHLVSKAAVRTTPVVESESLTLGGVYLSDLRADLREDAAVEFKAGREPSVSEEEWLKRFPLSAPDAAKFNDVVAEQARRIMERCNNVPNVEVPSGFDPVKKKSNTFTLTKARLDVALETTFGHDHDPKWIRNQDGKDDHDIEKFDFWTSVRFGPLTHS